MIMEMDAAAKGQVSASAAEIYDRFFVPALFGEWGEPLCRAAGVAQGERVLDVACGTGATTRAAAEIVGPGGNVTGIDRNDGMLDVARQNCARHMEFVDGMAEALPFEDGSFDRVLCQFALMFFEDREAALREMRRVLAPRGAVALSVWDRVETSEGYAGMISLLDRMFGREVADALRAPYVLGDRDVLAGVLASGGFNDAVVETRVGTARFQSIREWVRMDVRGWTLADMIDEDQFEALVAAAEQEFAGLVGSDGRVAFDAPAHLVTWSAQK
ncbi:class I SAM-dependent methyltransferase [Amaricoccus tamworthensis]|uniref:class I SAM-dependent methyltransferase n=1 Tax=Amaricoccus tamworthensis TaxID=57002 RepID=UPI003C7C5E58